MLGGDIGRLERRGDQAVRRGDIDDSAEAPLLYAGEHGAPGVERGREIDREDRVPLRGRESLDRRYMLDAGIVDEDVDRPELSLRLLDHVLDLGRLRHVGRPNVSHPP